MKKNVIYGPAMGCVTRLIITNDLAAHRDRESDSDRGDRGRKENNHHRPPTPYREGGGQHKERDVLRNNENESGNRQREKLLRRQRADGKRI